MQLLSRCARVWALIGGVWLAAIVAVTVVNVAAFALDAIARRFDATVPGISGYEDFVQLAVAAASPMFLPLCQVERGHLAVDFLTRQLDRAREQMLERIGALLTAIAAALLAVAMTFGMLETLADNALSRVLGWQVWPFYLPGIASLVLWSAIAGVQAFGGEHDPGAALQDADAQGLAPGALSERGTHFDTRRDSRREIRPDTSHG